MSKYWPSPLERFRKRCSVDVTEPVSPKDAGVVDIEEAHKPGLSTQMSAAPLPRELVSLSGTPLKEATDPPHTFVMINDPMCGSDFVLENLERIYPVVRDHDIKTISASKIDLSLGDAIKLDGASVAFIGRFPFDCAKELLRQRLRVINVLYMSRWDTTSRRVAVACRRGCCLMSMTGVREKSYFHVSLLFRHNCGKHDEDYAAVMALDVGGVPSIDPRMENMYCELHQCYTLDFFVRTFTS